MAGEEMGSRWRPLAAGVLAVAGAAALGAAAIAQWNAAGKERAPSDTPPVAATAPAMESKPPSPGTAGAPTAPQRFEAEGLAIEFAVSPIGSAGAPLREGDYADVRFRVTDVLTGEPVRGLEPGAWMDLGALPAVAPDAPAGGSDQASCRERVGLYRKGYVGIRPLVDLNGYYLLVLNQDPSISVIDPIVGMTGKTSLYATVILPGPGSDWARSRDDRRLYISIPSRGQVAVVDAEAFRVAAVVDAGKQPGRVALQPDGRYLWVADDASGVVAIDTETDRVAARIATGRGPHDLAFAGERLVYVANRDEGTVTAIDIAGLSPKAAAVVGSRPSSIAVSPLSGLVYVTLEESGEVLALDPEELRIVARIATAPSVGELRFVGDGRWGFVAHPEEHAVYVIDAARNAVVHVVPVPGRPYQLAATGAHLYVRLLDSERVAMIRLSSIGAGKEPIVQGFAAGTMPPGLVSQQALAGSIVPAATEAAVFVFDPAENQSYFYMEGMNAPMGSFRNYGHAGRAVTVIDRSLREVEPGNHAGRVRLPAAGHYQVALLLDAPRLLHCFSFDVASNPAMRRDGLPVEVEYLSFSGKAVAGEATTLRFRLLDAGGHEPKTGLGDVAVRWYVAPAGPRRETPAREVESGVYEATLRLHEPGAYYLHVGVPSGGVAFGALPYRTLLVTRAAGGGEEGARNERSKR